MPPKPKLFDSTVDWSFLRVLRHPVDHAVPAGISRFSVGGATLSRIARIEKIASTAPAAPSRCPVADLVDDIARP